MTKKALKSLSMTLSWHAISAIAVAVFLALPLAVYVVERAIALIRKSP